MRAGMSMSMETWKKRKRRRDRSAVRGGGDVGDVGGAETRDTLCPGYGVEDRSSFPPPSGSNATSLAPSRQKRKKREIQQSSPPSIPSIGEALAASGLARVPMRKPRTAFDFCCLGG
uniref:Uncharacterized protein n=1 Tax=Coccidioides posadasii RMSCC 3488 TaxID=454284 RepID=A0A0J6F1E4_COCPO|nr:hypothetical protein CPAG_03019 [Coccidioides posadasii RMSCC 3488]